MSADCLATELQRRKGNPRLEVLHLEDVDRRLAAIELTPHPGPGKQLEDFLGDLMLERLLNV